MPPPARPPAGPPSLGRVTVIVGANGAGKSSVFGAAIEEAGEAYFNPDAVARELRVRAPTLTAAEANAAAWELGRQRLERAIAERRDYTFETTLGGRTIAHEVAAYREGITIASAMGTGSVMEQGRDEPNGDVTLFSPFADALPAYRGVLATGPRYAVEVHRVHSCRTQVRDRVPAPTRRRGPRETR